MPDPQGRSSSRGKERSAESLATNPSKATKTDAAPEVAKSKPAASKPAASKPAASKPTASKPTASKPTASKATASKSAESKSGDSKSAAPKPARSKAAKSLPVPDQPDASTAATAADDVEASAEVAVPLNRAERRAKGKAHGQVQVGGRGKVTRSTGPAAGPRMWSNRRSG